MSLSFYVKYIWKKVTRNFLGLFLWAPIQVKQYQNTSRCGAVFVQTRYVNSNFNQCSMFRRCCFDSCFVGSNRQNHSSSDSHNPIKTFFIAKFAIARTWNGENKTILKNLEQQFVKTKSF